MTATDMSGQELSNVRCTASGEVRSWDREAWVRGFDEPTICPDCGYVGPIVWVRATIDLSPYAKTRAHKAPKGVTPAPYAVGKNGGCLWEQVQP